MKICEALLPCICCKVKSWTTLQRSVILLDQNSASVSNVWWKYTPLLDMISFSSFYFETWLAYFPFMSLHVLIIFLKYFQDLHCVPLFFFYTLGPSCVPFFFNLFAQPCCLFLKICQRDRILERGVFMLVVMENIFQCVPSVGIAIYFWCVGEFRSWENETSLNRVTKFDQTQHKVRNIC